MHMYHIAIFVKTQITAYKCMSLRDANNTNILLPPKNGLQVGEH